MVPAPLLGATGGLARAAWSARRSMDDKPAATIVLRTGISFLDHRHE